MGNSSFLVGGEPDCERPTEADGGESNVGRCEFLAGRSVVDRGNGELGEDVACGITLFGPVVVVEEWMHDIDRTEPSVDGGMQIPTQRLASTRLLLECGTTLGDRTVQDLDGDGVQQLLLVGEVSVERGDADPGVFGDGVSGRFATNFEDNLDCCVDD